MSPRTTEQETTTFMGAVTAPATHDLMNVLAIIGENAGLLSDLLHLGGAGALTPEQLQSGISAIEAQVARGRDLLTHLNRFAHASDPNPGSFDAGAAIAEVVQLTQRKFHTQLTPERPSHTVGCDPVLLRLLVFRLLTAASRPSQVEGPNVSLAPQPPHLLVSIQAQHTLEISEGLASLAEEIGATLSCRNNSFLLSLPPAAGAEPAP